MSAQARARAGKYQKPKRGGGKHFSRNLQPINADGEVENMWSARDRTQDSDDDDSDDEETSEEESEEESEEDDAPKQEMTREQRKAAAKARKDAAIAKQKAKNVEVGDMPSDSDEEDSDEDDAPANPNHTAKARAQTAKPAIAAEDGAAEASKKKDISQLSRREREALQAQQARERYQKLHAEGKTDEARADMERLKLVRERREAESARRKAEEEERAEQAKAKGDGLTERERRLREAAMGTSGKRGRGAGKKK